MEFENSIESMIANFPINTKVEWTECIGDKEIIVTDIVDGYSTVGNVCNVVLKENGRVSYKGLFVATEKHKENK